jgi:ABC-type transport system involved in multi-copper enzyme maturation permease subunit
LFAGPIIAREVLTSPRPVRFYVQRAAFAAGMFILMWTAWQALVGWREVREVGTLARFGGILYLLFAMLQLTLMLFFAPLAAATAVAHEKDRRTFVLLLMTDLSDLEIILGKLAASLVQILMVLAASVPVLSLCALLGGISFGQVANLFAVTAASGLAGGALGLLIALWRDRTYQSVSLTLLMVVLSVVAVEGIGQALPDVTIFGVRLVEAFNPYRATLAVLYPSTLETLGGIRTASIIYVALRLAFATALIVFATAMLRKWNPGRNEPREQREGEEAAVEAVEALLEVPEPELVGIAAGEAGSRPDPLLRRISGPSGEGDRGTSTGLHVPRRTHRRIAPPPQPYRVPWSNPILWRELRTRAYGTKPLIVKATFLLVAALIVGSFQAYYDAAGQSARAAWSILPVAILSLLLVNAQGVTALTSERDTGALDLLLVTELSPRQFIYGKLYGVLYNVKEMIALPVLMTLWYAFRGAITAEESVYIIIDFLLLCHFAAMLGLHAAITYTNSRTAVAHSLGVTFFLMAGILICAWLILLSNRDFGRQLLSFMVFIGVGSVALFGSLGARNPSQAIALVSLLTPFWSFFCIISLLRGDVLAAFLFSVGIYGFALLAMLIPAVSDFDIALGRTNAIQG